MADTPPQADPNGLMHIGAVAAHNITAALGLDVKNVGVVEQAIKDEISAMSQHFTLAIADVSTQHEVNELKLKAEFDEALAGHIKSFRDKVDEIKSGFRFARENVGKLIGIGALVFAVGVATGLVL